MADINVERKRPSIWPWIIGLLVLALLIWAIAEMVDTDEPEVAEVEEVEPVAPPVAVPAPGAPEEAVDLQTLMPLGPEDAGRTVRARGSVVGQPTEEGFWLLTDQDEVLFVLSTDQPQMGQAVETTGQITPARENQIDAWMNRAQLRPAAGWNVNRQVFLTTTVPEPAVPPGAQPTQPGMPPGQAQPGQPPAQQPGQMQPQQQQQQPGQPQGAKPGATVPGTPPQQSP